MDCQSCAGKVTAAVGAIDGVSDIEARAATGRLTVTHDATTAAETIVAAVERAGYTVSDLDEQSTRGEAVVPRRAIVWSPRGIRTAVSAIVLAIALGLEFALPTWDVSLLTGLGRTFSTADIAFLLATALAGTAILRAGVASLRFRQFDIDLLMSGGITGAVLVGLYLEAAMIAVLFSLAELLERYAMDRARDSVRELTELAPETATVRRDDTERVVPAASVAVGDTVLVRPGERVPVDGTVRSGESAIDESSVTGESLPVMKVPGDVVYAGTIASGGYLEVETTATADESTVARIADLVADAERNQTRHERFVDRFARYYTPIIVAGAVLTVAVPTLAFGQPWRPWFVRGLTLLVLACPCAFIIATPVGVVSGITAAARNGVLAKGGDHLEAMGAIDAVAFDKTGTLTMGDLSVTDVVPLGDRTEADVLACARGLEARSEHPLATAIVDAAATQGIEAASIESFEALAGQGVRADLDGASHYAGSPALFAELGFDLGHAHVSNHPETSVTDGGVVVPAESCERGNCVDLGETITRLEEDGKTVIAVGTEVEIEGVIAVADTVRPEAARAIAMLRDHGVTVAMLTGDNERTAGAVARRVGIDRVHAGLLPEEKVDAVAELCAEFEGVAMVGDGINDAPALATADVGIAMGAAGSDAAIETADVALLGDDLLKLPYLVRLSRRTTGVIQQNIVGSLGMKALLALGVPLGFVGVVEAIVIGDMGMSLGVTGNAMRLAGVSSERNSVGDETRHRVD